METYSNLEKLSNDLKNLFQNQNQEENHFDFEIICEQNQTSFKTHKSILSSRSHYFKSLFNSKMKEYQENKLILKDVSSLILSSILNYFYSGKIEINLENSIEILFFSSKYLIDELNEISLNFIKNHLQIEIIVDILKLSESMNFNQLIDSSYQFILENFKEFIKTPFFLELEENHLNSILSSIKNQVKEFEIFQAIIKWGKHKSNINQEKELEKEETEKLQNQISNVIDKIRFIDFSKEELEDTLQQDLIPNQISQKLIQFQILQNDEKQLKEFIAKENSLIFKPRIKFKSSILWDPNQVKELAKLLPIDNLYEMRLGFSTSNDGWDCKKWHDICDNKGKTLIIVENEFGCIFGGYTEVGWTTDHSKWNVDPSFSDCGWIQDPNAFLFSFSTQKDFSVEKIPLLKTKERYALYYSYNLGPFFPGGFDFKKDMSLVDTSYFGTVYQNTTGDEKRSTKSKKYLSGSDTGKSQVRKMETFFIPHF
ncbi:btb/poz domain-containing protein [Anaeramoeba ignava]|uniref:Btb/poz domain-containing protein n=1 Tax=Anaeramoeba ignava TaxID=1746090 RepID=A0A9Q0LHR6_ANAIG|nr:btb/poz domain-containing protein [Anaeramoeba ignava]